jgi:hypothetical protein
MTEMTSLGTDLLDCTCEPCLEEVEHMGRS